MTISNITLNHYLIISSLLFVVGIIGLFTKSKSVISILMSIELMLLSVNLNFIAFSSYLGDITGQIFVIFILAIGAAEVAIGLAILVLHFRNANSIEISDVNNMRG